MFSHGSSSSFHDFNKRVAVIRETFEECSLLLAEKKSVCDKNSDGKNNDTSATLQAFEDEFKDDFSGFCRRFGRLPQLD